MDGIWVRRLWGSGVALFPKRAVLAYHRRAPDQDFKREEYRVTEIGSSSMYLVMSDGRYSDIREALN